MKHLLLLIAAMSAPLCAADNTVSYQFPNVQVKSQSVNTQQLQSDEYWQKVSGKSLKKGVELNFSADDPLIRVSPKARYQDGIKTHAKQLDVTALKLVRSDGKAVINAKDVQHIKQQEMRHAGFADGSVALKLANMKNQKQVLLQSAESLNDDDEYLVHVKEKHSTKKLTVKASRKLHGTTLAIDNFALANTKVSANMVKVKLHSPHNEAIDVRFVPSKGFILSDLPDYVGAAEGLLSLEVQVTDKANGETVMRSINMPFFQPSDSASVVASKIVKKGGSSVVAQVDLAVQQEGRYSVRATLVASNDNQTFTPIATVETAGDLSSDGRLLMPFNVAKSFKFYKLIDIELKDQTRMLVLN